MCHGKLQQDAMTHHVYQKAFKKIIFSNLIYRRLFASIMCKKKHSFPACEVLEAECSKPVILCSSTCATYLNLIVCTAN